MSLYKRGTIWWTEFEHHGARFRYSTGTTAKREAKEFEARLKANVWRGTTLEGGRTWGEAVARWLQEHAHKKSLADDKDKLRWLTTQIPATMAIADISTDTVEKIIAARIMQPGIVKSKNAQPRKLSNATINRYLSALSTVLNSTVVWGWVPTVPKIRKLEETTARIRYLTGAEATKLLKELPPHLAEMARFTLATGLRDNNVLGLEWSQVDLKRHVAWIHADQAKGKKNIMVPLSLEALAVLKERQGKHKRWVFAYTETADGMKPALRCSTAAWGKAVARAGLGRFRWHDLRHTWASWHIQNGTPLEVLKELGGWSDLRMVMRYAHLSPGHIARWASNAVPTESPTADFKEEQKTA